MTEANAMEIGRFAYFWAWPMMNMHNRRTVLGKLPEPGLMGGIVPVSPANQLCMLRDYIKPQERLVACPNQDVVYGFCIDYLSRTAAAKANIFVNKTNETKYFYQDLDQEGVSLNGSANYAVTFPKGQLPPVQGFFVILRLYGPTKAFFDQTWKPDDVVKVR